MQVTIVAADMIVRSRHDRAHVGVALCDAIDEFDARARGLGVPEFELFSTEDLYHGENVKAVVTCILALGRRAWDIEVSGLPNLAVFFSRLAQISKKLPAVVGNNMLSSIKVTAPRHFEGLPWPCAGQAADGRAAKGEAPLRQAAECPVGQGGRQHFRCADGASRRPQQRAESRKIKTPNRTDPAAAAGRWRRAGSAT
eukprot:SAG11_NODE_5490_length_1547_cov_0.971685_2_plen_197_part_01